MNRWTVLLDDNGAGGGDDGNGSDPKPVPYERFQEVVGERNDLQERVETLQNKLNGMKGAVEKNTKPLQKQIDELTGTVGELKDKLNATTGELETERLRRLQVEVAAEKGLPARLASRLQGDDREALEADAEALKEYVKASPGIPPSGDGSQPPRVFDVNSMTPAEIREHADELMEQARQGM